MKIVDWKSIELIPDDWSAGSVIHSKDGAMKCVIIKIEDDHIWCRNEDGCLGLLTPHHCDKWEKVSEGGEV